MSSSEVLLKAHQKSHMGTLETTHSTYMYMKQSIEGYLEGKITKNYANLP